MDTIVILLYIKNPISNVYKTRSVDYTQMSYTIKNKTITICQLANKNNGWDKRLCGSERWGEERDSEISMVCVLDSVYVSLFLMTLLYGIMQMKIDEGNRSPGY